MKHDIYSAARSGNLKVLSKLIEKGGDVNSCSPENANCTALHIAAYSGREEIVNHLLEKGADINLGNDLGYTPLMVSSRQGYIKIVEILIEHNANINQIDKEGFAALIFAAGYSMDPKVIYTLIKKGADINSKTITGVTPLMQASWFGLYENVKILIKNNADKTITYNGKTPLDVAIEKGNKDIIMLLSSN
jgi:serine/threonine-protein phosphatase 6 regulatory ankyrin repeat subunit B